MTTGIAREETDPPMSASSDRDCPQPAGVVMPVIDRNRCEGKAECVAVCPVGLFELGVLPAAARNGLTMKGKLKGFVHGWRQAFIVRADACESCGKCVAHCPEGAIKLVRRDT